MKNSVSEKIADVMAGLPVGHSRAEAYTAIDALGFKTSKGDALPAAVWYNHLAFGVNRKGARVIDQWHPSFVACTERKVRIKKADKAATATATATATVAETPVAEAEKPVETPVVETPKVETPVVAEPVAEAPKTKAASFKKGQIPWNKGLKKGEKRTPTSDAAADLVPSFMKAEVAA